MRRAVLKGLWEQSNYPSSFITVSSRQMKASDGLDSVSKGMPQLKPVRRSRFKANYLSGFDSYLSRQKDVGGA